MPRFITNWWYSDQNILLVAPRAATPRSFLPATMADSDRRPPKRMSWTFV